MKLRKIDFEPVGRRGDCPAGLPLLEAAQRIADRVHYLEPTNAANFTKTFIDATYLGHKESR